MARVAPVFRFGQLVRLSCTFEDVDGNAIDPDVVIAKTMSPAGVETEYEVGASDPAVERDELGAYHVDVVADESGLWHFRFEASGTGASADEGRFRVAESVFE